MSEPLRARQSEAVADALLDVEEASEALERWGSDRGAAVLVLRADRPLEASTRASITLEVANVRAAFERSRRDLLSLASTSAPSEVVIASARAVASLARDAMAARRV